MRERLVFCSGKVYYDIVGHEEHARAQDVAVVRIEQLYTWPEAELQTMLRRYPQARELVWVQEEPSNMGAWTFVADRLRRIAPGNEVRLVARAASASPAAGSMKTHEREQHDLIHSALD